MDYTNPDRTITRFQSNRQFTLLWLVINIYLKKTGYVFLWGICAFSGMCLQADEKSDLVILSNRLVIPTASRNSFATDICFSGDDALIAAHIDHKVQVWNSRAGKLVAMQASVHADGLRFASKGKLLVWLDGSSVTSWDLNKGVKVQLRDVGYGINDVCFNATGESIFLSDDSGNITGGKIASDKALLYLSKDMGGPHKLVLAPGDQELVKICLEGTSIIDTRTGDTVCEIETVGDATFCSNARILCISDRATNCVEVWDVKQRIRHRRIERLPIRAERLSGIVGSDLVAVCGSRESKDAQAQSQTIMFVDVIRGKALECSFDDFGVKHLILAISLSPDGRKLAIHTFDGEIIIWDVKLPQKDFRD